MPKRRRARRSTQPLGVMRTVAALFTLLALVGCTALPKQMIGRFEASPDVIVVESDGKVFWARNTPADEALSFVGIGSTNRSVPGVLSVTTVSASQLWPEISYSADFSRINVQWRERVPGAATGRSVEFLRSPAQ